MPRQNILSDYFSEIARIRGTRAGTGEISYYGALTGALNAAGELLKPRVFCVPSLSGKRAGFPDMGLFVAAYGDQNAADLTAAFACGNAKSHSFVNERRARGGSS